MKEEKKKPHIVAQNLLSVSAEERTKGEKKKRRVLRNAYDLRLRLSITKQLIGIRIF